MNNMNKIEIDRDEYNAFESWRNEQLTQRIKPIQEFMSKYIGLENKEIRLTKDYWKLVNIN